MLWTFSNSSGNKTIHAPLTRLQLLHAASIGCRPSGRRGLHVLKASTAEIAVADQCMEKLDCLIIHVRLKFEFVWCMQLLTLQFPLDESLMQQGEADWIYQFLFTYILTESSVLHGLPCSCVLFSLPATALRSSRLLVLCSLQSRDSQRGNVGVDTSDEILKPIYIKDLLSPVIFVYQENFLD